MLSTEIITFNDNLYKVLRVFDEHPDFPIKETVQRLHVCDQVLRRGGKLYFCRAIVDAVILDQADEQVQLVEERTQGSTETETQSSPQGEVTTATAD